MQTAIVLSVVLCCVVYAAWRFYRVIRHKSDPCYGCPLKSERCGGCEGHCPQGHRMLESQQPGMETKAGAAALSIETVTDDGQP